MRAHSSKSFILCLYMTTVPKMDTNDIRANAMLLSVVLCFFLFFHWFFFQYSRYLFSRDMPFLEQVEVSWPL